MDRKRRCFKCGAELDEFERTFDLLVVPSMLSFCLDCLRHMGEWWELTPGAREIAEDRLRKDWGWRAGIYHAPHKPRRRKKRR